MGDRRGIYRVLVWKRGNRPLGKSRRILEGYIKMDLQEVGCGDMDWIEWLRMQTGGRHLWIR
jgi:hypothetical protein